ncbi:MAG: hypothetical protein AB8H79_06075 [Myxococcota bacterium]
MIALLLSLGSWAGPADEAHAKIEAMGPHVATYVKESTGEPRLEVHYRGPSEGSFRAISDEGVALVSVDTTHMRVSDGEGVCANVEMRSIFEAADAVSMGLDSDAYHSRLIYRATGDANLEISATFESREAPLLFSWHADLDDDATTLTQDKKYWQAVRNGSTWTVSKKTGILTRMSVGADALVLSQVVRGKRATPMTAVTVCPETTSIEAEYGIRDGLRLLSIIPPYSILANHWADLTPEDKQKATAGMEAWWSAYFADELPAAMDRWAEGEGPAALRARVLDRDAFEAFRKGLTEEQRSDPVFAWQQHILQQDAEGLMTLQLMDTVGSLTGSLDSATGFNDKTVRGPLLLEPMTAGMTANAEAVFISVLGPMLEEAGNELKGTLGE